MKLISTIIPVYNQEMHIKQCIDSVISQSHENIEIIIVDDGSSDSSRKIIDVYKTQDNRIRVLTQERKNAGAARNYGLSVATGEYIHFLDSDDWLERDAYRKLIHLADAKNSDLVIFLYKRYNQLTGEYRHVKLFNWPNSGIYVNIKANKRLLLDTSVVPWNKLYRKSYLDKIRPQFDELPVANDRTFHYSVVTKSQKITLLEDFLINYRDNNPESLMGAGRTKKFDSIILANANVLNTTKDIDIESRAIIYEANMKDIAYFYNKALGAKEKLDISLLISRYLHSQPYPGSDDSLQKMKWYLKYKVWKSIRTSNQKSIPVVLATNDNYAPYLYVTLQSVSDTLADGYSCDVYIFHTGLNEKYIKLFESATELNNLRIVTLNVSSLTTDHMNYSRAHYSPEMYYRLLIPEILEMYEKVIYLDCDLVVNRSLHELYEIDISRNYLGGVQNFCNDSMLKWIRDKLGLNPDNYVNSGVLLFNTEAFNSNNLKDKCLGFLGNNAFLVRPDQDMLNSVCKDHIKILDSGWNYQWHHGFFKYEQHNTIQEHVELVGNSSRKKYVVHYTSGAKAWSHPLYENADYFWKYARKSKVYVEILNINFKKKVALSRYCYE
jgi:lipopolysaccharide biosynthesis glycosyltransferase/glycosyltransferase involved in cell wall biosynthesis